MSVQATVTALPAPQRAQWRSVKYRIGDLVPGDVTRNSFGKWARVSSVNVRSDSPYVDVKFDSMDTLTARDVHLIDVQEVRPS